MSTKEPLATFRCKVFHEDGDTWVSGRSFALVDRSADGHFSLFEGPFHHIEPISFDGDIIDVRGSRLLVPEEWIERIGHDVTNWRVAWPNTQRDR